MSNPIDPLRRQWERNARVDPYWAILSRGDRRPRPWDRDEFFASGRADLERHRALLREAGIGPGPGPALDFGCGLGRLTRPLAAAFGSAVGVDVSTAMIAQAREIHAGVEGLAFVHNDRPDLGAFATGSFGFVYSLITLQHMPTAVAKAYLAELVRVCRPGGLAVVQIVTSGPPLFRGRFYWPPTLAKWMLQALNRRLALAPVMVMYPLPEAQARAVVEGAGGEVIAAWPDSSAGEGYESRLLVIRPGRASAPSGNA